MSCEDLPYDGRRVDRMRGEGIESERTDDCARLGGLTSLSCRTVQHSTLAIPTGELVEGRRDCVGIKTGIMRETGERVRSR